MKRKRYGVVLVLLSIFLSIVLGQTKITPDEPKQNEEQSSKWETETEAKSETDMDRI